MGRMQPTFCENSLMCWVWIKRPSNVMSRWLYVTLSDCARHVAKNANVGLILPTVYWRIISVIIAPMRLLSTRCCRRKRSGYKVRIFVAEICFVAAVVVLGFGFVLRKRRGGI